MSDGVDKKWDTTLKPYHCRLKWPKSATSVLKSLYGYSVLSVLKKPQISPNIWKFNNDLLKNDRSYQQVLALIEEIDKLDMSNLNKWEWFKFKVKKIAIDTGTFLSVRRKQKQREQIGEINSLVVNTQESPENSAKSQSLIAISTR